MGMKNKLKVSLTQTWRFTIDGKGSIDYKRMETSAEQYLHFIDGIALFLQDTVV